MKTSRNLYILKHRYLVVLSLPLFFFFFGPGITASPGPSR